MLAAAPARHTSRTVDHRDSTEDGAGTEKDRDQAIECLFDLGGAVVGGDGGHDGCLIVEQALPHPPDDRPVADVDPGIGFDTFADPFVGQELGAGAQSLLAEDLPTGVDEKPPQLVLGQLRPPLGPSHGHPDEDCVGTEGPCVAPTVTSSCPTSGRSQFGDGPRAVESVRLRSPASEIPFRGSSVGSSSGGSGASDHRTGSRWNRGRTGHRGRSWEGPAPWSRTREPRSANSVDHGAEDDSESSSSLVRRSRFPISRQHPVCDCRSDVLERPELGRREDKEGEVGVGDHGRSPTSRRRARPSPRRTIPRRDDQRQPAPGDRDGSRGDDEELVSGIAFRGQDGSLPDVHQRGQLRDALDLGGGAAGEQLQIPKRRHHLVRAMERHGGPSSFDGPGKRWSFPGRPLPATLLSVNRHHLPGCHL